jgi:Xaa-Pro aminopeptidase
VDVISDRTGTVSPPFDGARLDALMEAAGLDAVLVTSPHATRYLLGGYRFFLYDRLDPIGPSRYLPVVGYVRGRPDLSFFVGAGNEAWGVDAHPLWVPDVGLTSWSTTTAAHAAAERLTARLPAGGRARVGIEPPYVPSDAFATWAEQLAGASLVDATDTLDELRAIKTTQELAIMRSASDAVVDAMLATFAAVGPGVTTAEAAERLRVEETRRGLTYDYALVAAGARFGRAPDHATVVDPGDVLSLDSGADRGGYTADLTRMGIAGDPTPRHEDLLAQVDAVQQAVRAAVAPGRRGGDLFDVAADTIAALPDAANLSFLAHGTGLLTHEAPRLTDTGSPPYPATHRDRPLEPGMVLSIESQVADPELGFIKLEDTVFVTAQGVEAVGDRGRGWNRLGG